MRKHKNKRKNNDIFSLLSYATIIFLSFGQFLGMYYGWILLEHSKDTHGILMFTSCFLTMLILGHSYFNTTKQ